LNVKKNFDFLNYLKKNFEIKKKFKCHDELVRKYDWSRRCYGYFWQGSGFLGVSEKIPIPLGILTNVGYQLWKHGRYLKMASLLSPLSIAAYAAQV
jgi:hypothetical protein